MNRLEIEEFFFSCVLPVVILIISIGLCFIIYIEVSDYYYKSGVVEPACHDAQGVYHYESGLCIDKRYVIPIEVAN